MQVSLVSLKKRIRPLLIFSQGAIRFGSVLKYPSRRDGELTDRVSGGQPTASFNAADISRGRPACGTTVSTFVNAMEITGPPGRPTPTVPYVAETYAFPVAVDSNVYRRSGWSCWFREVGQTAESFDSKAAHNSGAIACFAEQGKEAPDPDT
jgi:hypothetical protein